MNVETEHYLYEQMNVETQIVFCKKFIIILREKHTNLSDWCHSPCFHIAELLAKACVFPTVSISSRLAVLWLGSYLLVIPSCPLESALSGQSAHCCHLNSLLKR